MLKQDYLLRMISEIITLIVNALLNKHKIRKENWVEYDCLTQQILEVSSDALANMNPEEIIDKYQEDPNTFGKIELAGMTMLKMANEMGNENLLLKSRLRQSGIQLLKYVQTKGNTFSIQRVALIDALEKGN